MKGKNLKLHFAEAQRDLRLAQTATQAMGYQTANAAQEQQDTAEALVNLANATLEDRNAVVNLTAANLNLTNYLAQKDEEITRLKKENAALQKRKTSR